MATKKARDKTSAEERRILREEKKIITEEKKIEKVEKEIVLKLGNLKVNKKHVFDIAKISGGALLGTGLGLNLVGEYQDIATQLPWFKVIGLLVMSAIIAALLLYHEEHADIKRAKHKWLFLGKRLLWVYIIAFAIVSVSAVFFSVEILPAELMVKILFIGSFSAVSGAVTFDLL